MVQYVTNAKTGPRLENLIGEVVAANPATISALQATFRALRSAKVTAWQIPIAKVSATHISSKTVVASCLKIRNSRKHPSKTGTGNGYVTTNPTVHPVKILGKKSNRAIAKVVGVKVGECPTPKMFITILAGPIAQPVQSVRATAGRIRRVIGAF